MKRECATADFHISHSILVQMKVLGIESSCDETAASVVEDGRRLLSNVVHSQIEIHKEYGGVVPEVAARSHLEVINPVIRRALKEAGCTWDDIDAIAVTYAPGLIGSLLVGTLAARTLALLHDKPLYPIHHVEAHVYANFIVEQSDTFRVSAGPAARSAPTSRSQARLEVGAAPPRVTHASVDSQEGFTVLADKTSAAQDSSGGGTTSDESRSEAVLTGSDSKAMLALPLPSSQPEFPMLALIVSGGHSQLVLFRDHGDYELLGQTQDDAVGEAFDKVAKILGLPYPGGPSIATAAKSGNPQAYTLPISKLQSPYDFSFSGLKTAVLRAVQREVGVDTTFPSHELSGLLNDKQKHDFAASFQSTAVKTLVDTAARAVEAYQPKSVVIAGGVAANQELRRQLAEKLPFPIEYPPMQLCTDNGAMIACLGYYVAQALPPTDPRDLKVIPSLPMSQTAWRR